MATTMAPPFPGVDEDWSKDTPQDLVDHGFTFVIGYVSEDITGKNITRAQINDYHAHGLDVALVYEFDPKAGQLGASRGAVDAHIAATQATALGAPRGTTIYFALDYPLAEIGDLATAEQYIQWADSVCRDYGYRADAYGDKSIISYLLDRNDIQFGWQTYAWSGGQFDPRAALRQTENGIHVGSATVDLDQAYTREFGQWRADGTAGTKGNGMELTDLTHTLKDDGHGVLVPDAELTVERMLQLTLYVAAQSRDTAAGNAKTLGTLSLQLAHLLEVIQAPAPAPAPSEGTPTPTTSEAQLLALWGRIADALERIAATSGGGATAPAGEPPAQAAATPSTAPGVDTLP